MDIGFWLERQETDGFPLVGPRTRPGTTYSAWDHVLGLVKIPCPGIVRKHA